MGPEGPSIDPCLGLDVKLQGLVARAGGREQFGSTRSLALSVWTSRLLDPKTKVTNLGCKLETFDVPAKHRKTRWWPRRKRKFWICGTCGDRLGSKACSELSVFVVTFQ